MGKITEALKKAAGERLSRIEKLDEKAEVKYEYVARKTVESNIDPRIVTFYDSLSPVAEQYRTLRTSIQQLKTDKPVRTLTVTSSSAAEGKTVTTINLAILMAHDMNKRRILLVDADLRRSKVARYLGITAETGLTDVLEGTTPIDDALLQIGIDNLTILPAGSIPRNPAELLGSTKMKSLMTVLKTKYDYILLDTPPIITVTDAAIVGAQSDGVVLVIKAGTTQKGVIRHSELLLKQAQARLLGYVLTNIKYHIPAYIYRYL